MKARPPKGGNGGLTKGVLGCYGRSVTTGLRPQFQRYKQMRYCSAVVTAQHRLGKNVPAILSHPLWPSQKQV